MYSCRSGSRTSVALPVVHQHLSIKRHIVSATDAVLHASRKPPGIMMSYTSLSCLYPHTGRMRSWEMLLECGARYCEGFASVVEV